MRCRDAIGGLLLSAVLAGPAAAESPRDSPPAPAPAPRVLPGVAVAEARALWEKGISFYLFQDYRGAATLFERSIALHPTAAAHTHLGRSLGKLGRVDEAIEQCKRALRVDPEYGDAYTEIGVYLISLGRHDEARSWLERALLTRRYCCYQHAHYHLGRIHFAQGRWIEAERAFRAALGYDPDYRPAREALEFLDTLGVRGL